MSLETLGWIACILGIIYPLFQLQKVIQTKDTTSISRKFLIFWALDKLVNLLYVAILMNPQLFVKYLVGLIAIGIIIKYKFTKIDTI